MTYAKLLTKIKKEIKSYDGHNEVCKEWLALRAVVELHKSNDGLCKECTTSIVNIPHPCSTIQAIEKDLG